MIAITRPLQFIRLAWSFILLLAGVGVATAAAPATIDGLVFLASSRTLARTSAQTAFLLENGGTARGLYSASTALAGPTLFNIPPRDATWTYRRIDEREAELVLTFDGGSSKQQYDLTFTADFSGTAVRPGIVGETFRLRPLNSPRPLVNCSNRSAILPGGSAFTGFVVAGDEPRAVLIRAIGPALTAFGITDALVDPRLRVTGFNRLIAENDDWDTAAPFNGGESIRRVSALVGAFGLPASSKDAALVLELAPGAYVAEAAAPDGGGQVLLEVYMLP